MVLHCFQNDALIKRKCPELGGFEVIGITLTRNKLIEHDNGIYSANITIDGPGGPEIKGPRWDGQSQDWADPGMFANAAEFDRQLRDLLMPYVRTSPDDSCGRMTGPGPRLNR